MVVGQFTERNRDMPFDRSLPNMPSCRKNRELTITRRKGLQENPLARPEIVREGAWQAGHVRRIGKHPDHDPAAVW
jgi:hypothetical protein